MLDQAGSLRLAMNVSRVPMDSKDWNPEGDSGPEEDGVDSDGEGGASAAAVVVEAACRADP